MSDVNRRVLEGWWVVGALRGWAPWLVGSQQVMFRRGGVVFGESRRPARVTPYPTTVATCGRKRSSFLAISSSPAKASPNRLDALLICVPILFKYADHLLLGFDIWPWYEKLTNLFRIDIGYADDLTADLVYLDAPSRRDDLGARSARPEKRSLVDIATVHGHVAAEEAARHEVGQRPRLHLSRPGWARGSPVDESQIADRLPWLTPPE